MQNLIGLWKNTPRAFYRQLDMVLSGEVTINIFSSTNTCCCWRPPQNIKGLFRYNVESRNLLGNLYIKDIV